MPPATGQRPTPQRQRLTGEAGPFAWRAVSSIAAVVAAAHLAASFLGGYWFDEVYMLAIGRNHLAWGSADQPPLTPLLAALMDWLAPGSIVALRLPAVLATAAAVLVAALIARELGGDRRAQVLTAGAQATALWVTLAGHWLTPYTLEPLQWLTIVWLIVRWLLLRGDHRFLAVTFLALYAFYVITVGRPYYLDGLYGALAAAGAVGLQRRREAGHRRWRWVAWPAYVLSAAAAVGMLGLSVTMVQGHSAEQIVQRTANAYHALPADEREHTAIMGQSYILAAYVDGYADRYHLPSAYSGNRSYGFFAPPKESQRDVLYVGASPERLRPYFGSVRKVADGGKDASVWLATGRHRSWTSIWPKLRSLTVS